MLGHETYIFSSIQVFDVIDVDITKENETLDMVRVKAHQLVEEGCCLQRAMVISQQQRKVEQC